MTDDIFDYFGESPRKVEPVESDDFFEDLMPKAPIEEEVENEAKDDQQESPQVDDEIIELVDDAAELPVESDELRNVEAPVSSSVDSSDLEVQDDYDLENHWDSLATSLGLEAPAKNLIDDEEFESEPVGASESMQDSKGDVVEEIFDLEMEQQTEDSNNPLSEMFVPRTNEEFDEPTEVAEPVAQETDEDPFAAFHRPVEVGDDPVQEEEPVGETGDESHLVVGDDFVEFDVKEFDKGDRSKEGRGRRRRERTSKGGVRQDQNERGGRKDRSGRNEDSVEGKEVRRKRKSRRDESVDSESDVRESNVRESRNRQRSRRNRDEHEDDSRARKKPKIPTWDEAVGGMIEKNIKRHKSGSGRGGGGGRKRRH